MRKSTAGILCLCIASAVFARPTTAPATSQEAATGAKNKDEVKMPLIFKGGYDTDPRDRGRPVVLIAAALKVPDEVFRETFTHVKPAGPGSGGPTDAEARKNKAALMKGLAPYGVTDERLNEVSNFYRYSRGKGEMWRNAPAEGYATVRDGVVTGITITNAGYGYSSEPKVSVTGLEAVELKSALAYGTDFKRNGSVQQIAVVAPAAK
ncbi:MAG TPA: hypothetical protein VLJ39_10825 [Tepidisphaeraceae bacterium]|nr:hypothetical protein [Tepidisphaeraceae bacterium]